MKNIFTRKNWTILGILAALLFATAFSVPQASANSGQFNIDVAHLINGKDLGLDKELPVDVYINGNLAIPYFTFGEKISTTLPAGQYTINVTLTDGTPLPSMTVGPVQIPAGTDVSIKARLDNETPVLKVKASESMKEMVSDGTFDVKVRHSIDGRSLGLNKALPVNVYINGNLAIPRFEFGDVVTTSLRAGTYSIAVTLLDGTPLPSMDLGPVDLPADADVLINAKLSADKTPILFPTVR
jgi:CRISPR/Cas system-associated exonuclease Cas4 (RecB family)